MLMDPEIAETIYTIFTERQRHEALVQAKCQELLTFYRSTEESQRIFPLQFIPVLIYTYLHAVAAGDKESARSVETLLICIYNTEVSNDDGVQRVLAFRMPVLAQPSVYHEEKSLPITDLRRWEENCNRDIKWGPHTQIEAITAQNRLNIMTVLLFCYNQQVNLTQKAALIHLCRVASKLVNQGFPKQSGHSHRNSYGSDSSSGSLLPKPVLPRIPLSSGFLVELVHAIYFAMFNGFGTVATQTLEDIHQRACFEMYTDLILVTSAVLNSFHANPSGQPNDGPMGLSVALTPVASVVAASVSKSIITNASFRTKKLPDDIPIQVEDFNRTPGSQHLPSVMEEVDQGGKEQTQPQSSRNSIIRPSMEGIKAQAHKALIAGFKKTKDKEREKDKYGKTGSSPIVEPPKPPLRKLYKHNQRNSLLQLQVDASDQQKNTNASDEHRYDTKDAADLLPTQALTANESGSNSFSFDSEINADGIIGGILPAKSFESSLQLASIGISGKARDAIVD